MQQNLIIRADASPEIGVGHIMRCLAIAQVWQASCGRVWFAGMSIPDAIRDRLQMEGFEFIVLDAAQGPRVVVDHAARRQVSHVILDGQHFDSNYQHEIKKASLYLLVLDDYGHAGRYYADCVVNSDLVTENMYAEREPYTRLFLGPSYALLRKEFKRSNKTSESASRNIRILITMGGSDPQNMTSTAMQAIEGVKGRNVELRVIVGGANPRLEVLRKFAEKLPVQTEVLNNLSDMPAQMQWADIAVVAAGVTLWELLYMGTAVICWPRYTQDVQVLAELKNKGAVIPLALDAGPDTVATALTRLLSDLELMRNMQSAGGKIIDGLGANRVVEIFSQLPAANLEGSQAH